MKKLVFFAAVAVLVLASCAKTETYVKATFDDAVTFGAYSGRTITKAGATEDMNLDSLKSIGFGVFATYSATDTFTVATNDFMYNQKVNHDGTAWTYSPIKYWPNPTNGQNADDQKVSFFAYAPYCEPGTSETTGITGFEIDGTTKHNIVNYAFANNAPNVDLMWGYKTGVDLTDTTINHVNVDLTRTAETVKFTFQHVLSKLGGSQEGDIKDPEAAGYVANGLMVKAAPTSDPTAEYGTITTGEFGGAKGTKITISYIKVESAPEIDAIDSTNVKDIDSVNVQYATGVQTGKLDLFTGEFVLDNTATPVKFKQELSADADSLAAHDDLSEIADFLKEIPSPASFAAVNKGVTKTPVNVYKEETTPIILVPGTKPVVDVTISYVVRTYDEKLPKGYSEVPQTVWGRIKFPKIEKNKKYNILMILGLNNVKFEATVENWSKGNTWVDANNDGVVDDNELTGNEQTIDLPKNLTI